MVHNSRGWINTVKSRQNVDIDLATRQKRSRDQKKSTRSKTFNTPYYMKICGILYVPSIVPSQRDLDVRDLLMSFLYCYSGQSILNQYVNWLTYYA